MITIGSCTLPFAALASRSGTDLEQRFGGGEKHYSYIFYSLEPTNVRIKRERSDARGTADGFAAGSTLKTALAENEEKRSNDARRRR